MNVDKNLASLISCFKSKRVVGSYKVTSREIFQVNDLLSSSPSLLPVVSIRKGIRGNFKATALPRIALIFYRSLNFSDAHLRVTTKFVMTAKQNHHSVSIPPKCPIKSVLSNSFILGTKVLISSRPKRE